MEIYTLLKLRPTVKSAEFIFPLLAAGVTCVFSSNVVFIFQEIKKETILKYVCAIPRGSGLYISLQR